MLVMTLKRNEAVEIREGDRVIARLTLHRDITPGCFRVCLDAPQNIRFGRVPLFLKPQPTTEVKP